MYSKTLEKLMERKDLSQVEMEEMMDQIMSGKLTDSQISAVLTALRIKGETKDEITGCAKVMREKAAKVRVLDENAIDTCGTGGDGKHTINISTVSAIIAATAGVTVVKHGNRSVSSKCGSADVLSDLGVKIDLDPSGASRCLDKAKIAFLFAPIYHPSMKYVMNTRRELGIRTIFNILGPLANPGLVKNQIVGVFDANLTEMMAEVLKELGLNRALVIHGMDGLDEISISDETKVTELKNGQIRTYMIKPEDFGMKRASIENIKGGSSKENANMLIDLLKGNVGNIKDVVLLNSGAAIYVGGKARTIAEGIEIARSVLDSGKAFEKLEELKAVSNLAI
ncbi:anthranilate phosphoribosyltransferase [Alkalibacter mobilis]|uniref:anthranilate phosphoribosyltransferase n=1 Tax=Alkalibacter mobilis TaxID=2787712 RepID=UPI00189E22A6|nr:anthranilate phosphoribosyltransferase [Alkalibacter mobilis]MBF7096993.1 anthranilate phosphoribosyltransferase [Alkalibacter mobilis]